MGSLIPACTRGVCVACLTCAAARDQRSRLTRDFTQPVQNGCTFRPREEQGGEKVLRKVGRFQTVMRNRVNVGLQSSVPNINLQTLTEWICLLCACMCGGRAEYEEFWRFYDRFQRFKGSHSREAAKGTEWLSVLYPLETDKSC